MAIEYRRFASSMALFFIGMVSAVHATAATSDTCRNSAKLAAAKTGIPENILHAISLTETGRKRNGSFEPWPWTVNMEGKGVWFDTRKAAFDYATKNFNRGARSFDVGCFQINYKWHHQAFQSIEQMFDPDVNAVYAAQYLLSLHAEKGNWEDAVGAYHSRTKKFADRYKARFKRIHSRLNGSPDLPKSAKQTPILVAEKPRENLYPLLFRHKEPSPTSNGSIVSLQKTTNTGLIVAAKGRLF